MQFASPGPINFGPSPRPPRGRCHHVDPRVARPPLTPDMRSPSAPRPMPSFVPSRSPGGLPGPATSQRHDLLHKLMQARRVNRRGHTGQHKSSPAPSRRASIPGSTSPAAPPASQGPASAATWARLRGKGGLRSTGQATSIPTMAPAKFDIQVIRLIRHDIDT